MHIAHEKHWKTVEIEFSGISNETAWLANMIVVSDESWVLGAI